MQVEGNSVLVTGGASGLGLATAKRMLDAGARVVIADLPSSDGEQVAAAAGEAMRFVAADVTSAEEITAAVAAAQEMAPLRATIHCAGRGGSRRIVDRDGNAAEQDLFDEIIRVNLLGSINVLRLAAAQMTRNGLVGEEAGVVVMTASAAAFEGQIGQAGYAASKGGVVGLTICAARDLAARGVRVCTIAPGLMDTPLLGRLPEEKRQGLAESVSQPKRLGDPDEYAALACQIVENQYLNGETIRLDGAIRMPARS
ncbi:MAG: SDR family NAD(P)-dependent oxidoreductase [Actinobacteria bacterium]|nr:SDR family NAD(P)-dependent oxidoreductase [Actinomycetota bacterium]